jgi:hypothetical protein
MMKRYSLLKGEGGKKPHSYAIPDDVQDVVRLETAINPAREKKT